VTSASTPATPTTSPRCGQRRRYCLRRRRRRHLLYQAAFLARLVHQGPGERARISPVLGSRPRTSAGRLVRPELELATPQGPVVRVADRDLINFCVRAIPRHSSHREVKKAATTAIEAWGAGARVSSRRGGTLTLHLELERAIASSSGRDARLRERHTRHGPLRVARVAYGFCERWQAELCHGLPLPARRVAYRNNTWITSDRLKRRAAARFRISSRTAASPDHGKVATSRTSLALAELTARPSSSTDSEGSAVVGLGQGT